MSNRMNKHWYIPKVNTSQEKKEGMDFWYINMNNSEHHYAEKGEIQEYILCDSIYMKFKNRLSLWLTEMSTIVAYGETAGRGWWND